MPKTNLEHGYSSECEEDDDDDNRMKRLHDQRRKLYHNDHPTTKDLKNVADYVLRKLAEVNNDEKFRHEVNLDTIAVGLSKGDILVTANVKTRRETNSEDKAQYFEVKTPDGTKQKLKYDDYGISTELSNVILSEIQKSEVYKKSGLNVKVIEEKLNPRDNSDLPKMMDKAKDHASKHAETKMNAYCEETGAKLSDIGISKEACQGCHEELTNHGVVMEPETPGTKKVTNRRTVDKDEVEVRNKIDRNKQTEVNLHIYNNNIHLSKTKLKETMKNNMKRSFKPGASVGVFSGSKQLYDTITNEKVQPYADGGVLNARAGSTDNALGGKTYGANASVVEGRTGFGDLVSIGASALSAGAYAEYGLNNSVGANLSLVRVDGNLGPVQAGVGLNFDTHASIGPNGVSASFLGMGFSAGPRIGIQTPFLDFSVSLF